jgi:hypothetical protein
MIDLAFPLLRSKEVIFDRRAPIHPVSSDSHLLNTILKEPPTDQRLIEVPVCCTSFFRPIKARQNLQENRGLLSHFWRFKTLK